MDATELLADARAELERDMPVAALRSAWEAAFAADYVRNSETLDEIRELAGRIEERTEGGEREEARRLAVFCEACGDDIRAAIPHDSALGRLFRKR